MTIFWIIVLITAYATPTVIARLRHVIQWDAVAVVNLLLGWTGIGWIAAMVMACAMKTRPPAPAASPYPYSQVPQPLPPPQNTSHR